MRLRGEWGPGNILFLFIWSERGWGTFYKGTVLRWKTHRTCGNACGHLTGTVEILRISENSVSVGISDFPQESVNEKHRSFSRALRHHPQGFVKLFQCSLWGIACALGKLVTREEGAAQTRHLTLVKVCIIHFIGTMAFSLKTDV